MRHSIWICSTILLNCRRFILCRQLLTWCSSISSQAESSVIGRVHQIENRLCYRVFARTFAFDTVDLPFHVQHWMELDVINTRFRNCVLVHWNCMVIWWCCVRFVNEGTFNATQTLRISPDVMRPILGAIELQYTPVGRAICNEPFGVS